MLVVTKIGRLLRIYNKLSVKPLIYYIFHFFFLHLHLIINPLTANIILIAMKSPFTCNTYKAIAFLTIVISMFSCTACDPDLDLKPQVTIGAAENVTDSSATLVAYVTPNGEAEVFFSYQANNSAWLTTKLVTKFSGNTAIKVSFDLSDLQTGTNYQFKVESSNKAGLATSEISSFATVTLAKAIAIISPATDVKISTAKVNATITPNQNNTKVTFEYQTTESSWSSQTLPTNFDGSSALNVSFDLSDLQANTKYNFRVKVSNKAGESVSEISTFETYAVTDFDGNFYHTVTIGNQTWLRENFKGTHFLNGDPIPNITDQAQWEAATSPAYCYYNNDPEIGKVYGALYNWYTASDSRGLISGYHVPTEAEFRTIAKYLGGSEFAGGAMKEVGFAHWIQPNKGATNSSGFTGLPAGSRKEVFGHLGDDGTFWTSDRFFGMLDQGYVFGLGEIWAQLTSGGCYNWQGRTIRLIKN